MIIQGMCTFCTRCPPSHSAPQSTWPWPWRWRDTLPCVGRISSGKRILWEKKQDTLFLFVSSTILLCQQALYSFNGKLSFLAYCFCSTPSKSSKSKAVLQGWNILKTLNPVFYYYPIRILHLSLPAFVGLSFKESLNWTENRISLI